MKRLSKTGLELICVFMEKDVFDHFHRKQIIMKKTDPSITLNDAIREDIGMKLPKFHIKHSVPADYTKPEPLPDSTRTHLRPSLTLDEETAKRVIPLDESVKTHSDKEETDREEDNGLDKDNPNRFFIPKKPAPIKEPEPIQEEREEPPPVCGIFIPAPPRPYEDKPKIKPKFRLRDEK